MPNILDVGTQTLQNSRIINSEWLTMQHRDTLSSYIGHNSLLSMISIVENESRERMRTRFLDVNIVDKRYVQPCGPAPKKEE